MRHLAELVLYQVYADLRAESTRGFLGVLWWVLEPVLFVAVLYTVFRLGFRKGGEDFVLFLLCGLVIWKWFAATAAQGSRSIITKALLMQQVYLPKAVFPSVVVCTNTVKFLFTLVVLLGFLVLYGVEPALSWVILPVLVLTQFAFIAATATALAAVVPFLPDILLLVETGLFFLFFVSGIFFDIGSVSGQAGPLLALNPMAALISSYRAVLLRGEWPRFLPLAAIAVFSAISLLGTWTVMRRVDRDYPKLVS